MDGAVIHARRRAVRQQFADQCIEDLFSKLSIGAPTLGGKGVGLEPLHEWQIGSRAGELILRGMNVRVNHARHAKVTVIHRADFHLLILHQELFDSGSALENVRYCSIGNIDTYETVLDEFECSRLSWHALHEAAAQRESHFVGPAVRVYPAPRPQGKEGTVLLPSVVTTGGRGCLRLTVQYRCRDRPLYGSRYGSTSEVGPEYVFHASPPRSLASRTAALLSLSLSASQLAESGVEPRPTL